MTDAICKDGKWRKLNGSDLSYDEMSDVASALEGELNGVCEWRYSHSEIEASCGGEAALDVRSKVMRRRNKIRAKAKQ